jgi:hypothetical protein
MKNYLAYGLSILLGTAMISCSSDDDAPRDSVAPIITLNEPFEDEIIAPGGEVHFDADFTDNEALQSYKIDIHYAGDGHSHRPITFDEDHDHGEEWAFEITGMISGTSANAHMHIDVPTMIEHDGEMHPIKKGAYHFSVFALDAAGNQSLVVRDIFIEDHDHDHDHDQNQD